MSKVFPVQKRSTSDPKVIQKCTKSGPKVFQVQRRSTSDPKVVLSTSSSVFWSRFLNSPAIWPRQ
eukprot:3308059-Heterocapsa_arctica.AAC.1